jgi:hypothetical protein
MTNATDEATLRVALANAESLRVKRNALAVALAESATVFHKAMKHGFGDWRGGCGEDECRKAWLALSTHGGK